MAKSFDLSYLAQVAQAQQIHLLQQMRLKSELDRLAAEGKIVSMTFDGDSVLVTVPEADARAVAEVMRTCDLY